MSDDLRREARNMVNGHDLQKVQPDRGLAEQRLAMAEEHLASGRANRKEKRVGAARSAFYEAIWYALLALLGAEGLRLVADREDGNHVVLMKFGRCELESCLLVASEATGPGEPLPWWLRMTERVSASKGDAGRSQLNTHTIWYVH